VRQRREIVEGIPVVLVEPDGQRGAPVLWMSYLGGYAERNLPMLARFASAGHPAASFDAPGHGARGSGDRQEFARHVLAAFRRRMWPLLGQTTLEALRVLDWLGEEADASEGFLVGGFSMGGDAAVALAGIDQRVRRVAAIGSTPDWSRPGMHELGDRARPLDQGEADAYAGWFATQLDPMRHLDRFRRDLAIDFELGGEDRHIPEANARAFAEALAALDPPASATVEINVHPGLDHGVVSDQAAKDAAFAFLLDPA
jgi:dienelactone hydrolase